MKFQEKIEAVEDLSGRFNRAPIAIVTHYRGLTVAQLTELRRSVREAEGEFLVAKNTLTRRAIRDTSSSGIEPLLSGPTALAFGFADPLAVAKAVHTFAKSNEALDIRGAVLDGDVLEAGQVGQLASMPSRDELRAKLLSVLVAPATQLVRLLQTPAQQLASVLQARVRKGE
jgi:large subunit ribosomal protein L10